MRPAMLIGFVDIYGKTRTERVSGELAQVLIEHGIAWEEKDK